MSKKLPEIYEEIIAVADEPTARKIADLFQGCQVYFPLWDRSAKQRERDAAIYRDFCAGVDFYDLARKYGLTERRIRAIIEERQPRQLPLPL